MVCPVAYKNPLPEIFQLLSHCTVLFFRTNQITEVCVRSNNDLMWVGTEGGAIYSLSLPEFEPNNDATIHQDQVMQRYVL